MKRIHATLLGAAFGAATLAGCEGGSVKEMVGLDRSAPDEFRVATRPPLSVPPEFTLRPPGDTAGAAQDAAAAHHQAQSLIIGNGGGNTFALPSSNEAAPAAAAVSAPVANSADAQFLKNAGADIADSNVRSILQEEKFNRQLEKEEASWWDSVTEWDKKEPIVDAKKEAERIQKNQEDGKPVTEGEVAETKEKDTGVLGRIFGDW